MKKVVTSTRRLIGKSCKKCGKKKLYLYDDGGRCSTTFIICSSCGYLVDMNALSLKYANACISEAH